MESLIPIINKLQDVVNTIGCDGIELPQIVVVGTQSSGKSSVLENIVGRSFLPRGTGIVTRTPLVLQLVHSPKVPRQHRRQENGTLDADEYGVFLHSKIVFTNFEEIRKEIERKTESITGTNKGISDEVISLKIYSPKVVNLTLVDLPGLTKVPVGDQPRDIETQIRSLVLKYIENPNSIIMAVVTANTDMATNESLKLAKDCDPKGDRTLAVVTKLDLMDAGTDATDILCGRVIPVKLGIIAVINRSQKDIMENKEISAAQKDETEFLLKKYPTLTDCNGTAFLAKTLNKLLMKHIKDCLPDLKKRVQLLITQNQDILKSYGDTEKDKDKMMLKIITDISSAYNDLIMGVSANLKGKTLVGGARICYIFHETFKNELCEIDPVLGLAREDIVTLMRNFTGPTPNIFIPEAVFDLLVKEIIKYLQEPSLQCAELVYEEMKQMFEICISKMELMLQRFPALRLKILDLISDVLDKRRKITKDTIRSLIAIELSYINKLHPRFDKHRAMSTQLHSQNEQELEARNPRVSPSVFGDLPFTKFEFKEFRQSWMYKSEEKDCVILENLLKSYFDIVRTTIHDLVMKTVMHSLVNFVKDNVHQELLSELYRSADTEKLFQEAKHIAEIRQKMGNLLRGLYQASNIINEIKDFYV